MTVTVAAEVPHGTVIAANVRQRAGDVSDLQIVVRGDSGHDPRGRAIVWVNDVSDLDMVVGFVMEGEPVVIGA